MRSVLSAVGRRGPARAGIAALIAVGCTGSDLEPIQAPAVGPLDAAPPSLGDLDAAPGGEVDPDGHPRCGRRSCDDAGEAGQDPWSDADPPRNDDASTSCTANTGCTGGLACGYLLSGGCQTSGVCVPYLEGTGACDLGVWCTCAGETVQAAPACGYTGGAYTTTRIAHVGACDGGVP
jgi:hypothetical protein